MLFNLLYNFRVDCVEDTCMIIRIRFCHCCIYIFLVFIVIQVDGCGKSELGEAIMYNFTSYANGIHGLEFSVVGNIKIIGFKLADNRDNGIEIQETLGVWGGAVIQVHNYVLCNVKC